MKKLIVLIPFLFLIGCETTRQNGQTQRKVLEVNQKILMLEQQIAFERAKNGSDLIKVECENGNCKGLKLQIPTSQYGGQKPSPKLMAMPKTPTNFWDFMKGTIRKDSIFGMAIQWGFGTNMVNNLVDGMTKRGNTQYGANSVVGDGNTYTGAGSTYLDAGSQIGNNLSDMYNDNSTVEQQDIGNDKSQITQTDFNNDKSNNQTDFNNDKSQNDVGNDKSTTDNGVINSHNDSHDTSPIQSAPIF